jgi:uncharacterized GH25 family protein
MKKTLTPGLLIFMLITALSAHDMFLKLETFFLKPHTAVTISLYNGTFEKSENVITRDRMQDISIAGPQNERVHPDTLQWRDAGATTLLDFKTGGEGTYVAGVSTKPRMIELAAKDFNEYLEHDGVLDVLASRKEKGELDKEARELYSKHVKAVFQVGQRRSDGFKAKLGYPIEIVPLQNPYHLGKGEVLEALVLKNGQPVANQLVYASFAGYHKHGDEGNHAEAVKTRTDQNGVAKIELSKSGHWYIRLIHMVSSDEEGVDYESNWATLTFEIK